MIGSARVFFLRRALREKLLLVAFIGIGALWWGSSFLTRGVKFWREQRTMTFRLKDQAEWIKNKTLIEETAKKTASRLDPARTLGANQLVTTVSQMANDAGLKYITTAGTAVSTTSGQFAVHSQEFTVRNIEGAQGWESLRKFYESLQQRSPYISIERLTLQLVGNTTQLVLSLKVNSVEIPR